MTDEEYTSEIDAEAIRQKYMKPGTSLVALSGGAGPWLEAWREDPTLTPAEQVEAEIISAMDSM